MKPVFVLFLPEFRLLIVFKIAALSELAITIGVKIPTFLGFKHRLVHK
jgi:hypothetical protein